MQSRKIRIFGVVQGVGFRPFVKRLADALGVKGSVANQGSYVEIAAQGEALSEFRKRLELDAPERAAILRVEEFPANLPPFADFTIAESAPDAGAVFVSPDIATCETCRRELFDEHNRRYLHPFINCTACGPRLTILNAMPYDRERTGMSVFPMCKACEREYTAPASRRFDAQPVCCNECGPEVALLRSGKRGKAAITEARRLLIAGKIVAIKGIGGFHLACDAYNAAAVARLRSLKHRPAKPFAVIMRDLAAVKRECEVSPEAAKMLTDHQKPIVLLPHRADGKLPAIVAPGNPTLGVMLPYVPIQMLLFDYPDRLVMPEALVMTSGNAAGAPICRDEATAEAEIGAFCDEILSHNRAIGIRADDSVMTFFEHKPYMIRRSRGFAPLPFRVDGVPGGCVLGIGGELKNCFCLAKNGLFYPSAYLGDMEDWRTGEALVESVKRMQALLGIAPEKAVCDLHPEYRTAEIAASLGIPVVRIQHHFAHILSCMAENNCLDPVIGIALDGTGYGTDGTIWGGEILRVAPTGFTRLSHLAPFWQCGGDAASREGWRIAAGWLHALEPSHGEELAQKLDVCSPGEYRLIGKMLETKVNTVKSTSAGRLFDGVAALLGVSRTSSFEGESAMKLEFAATAWRAKHPEWELGAPEMPDADGVMPTQRMIEMLLAGGEGGELALAFHARLARQIAGACIAARQSTGLNICALSGGTFQNLLLLELTTQILRENGFRVLLHTLIPANDGGIALGQALAGMMRDER